MAKWASETWISFPRAQLFLHCQSKLLTKPSGPLQENRLLPGSEQVIRFSLSTEREAGFGLKALIISLGLHFLRVNYSYLYMPEGKNISFKAEKDEIKSKHTDCKCTWAMSIQWCLTWIKKCIHIPQSKCGHSIHPPPVFIALKLPCLYREGNVWPSGGTEKFFLVLIPQ